MKRCVTMTHLERHYDTHFTDLLTMLNCRVVFFMICRSLVLLCYEHAAPTTCVARRRDKLCLSQRLLTKFSNWSNDVETGPAPYCKNKS